MQNRYIYTYICQIFMRRLHTFSFPPRETRPCGIQNKSRFGWPLPFYHGTIRRSSVPLFLHTEWEIWFHLFLLCVCVRLDLLSTGGPLCKNLMQTQRQNLQRSFTFVLYMYMYLDSFTGDDSVQELSWRGVRDGKLRFNTRWYRTSADIL